MDNRVSNKMENSPNTVNTSKKTVKNTNKNTTTNTTTNTVKNTTKNTVKNTNTDINSDNKMEKFTMDILNIYELINKNKDVKSLVNIVVISKQYLAYYLYRIMAKFMNAFEVGVPSSDINNILTLLRIPAESDRYKNYPLAGKMTNDEKILDLIILSIIDMLVKVDKYIHTLPNTTGYSNLYEFIAMKDLPVIIQDLVDLQKLIPGLSVSAIRPNYIDDEKLQ